MTSFDEDLGWVERSGEDRRRGDRRLVDDPKRYAPGSDRRSGEERRVFDRRTGIEVRELGDDSELLDRLAEHEANVLGDGPPGGWPDAVLEAATEEVAARVDEEAAVDSGAWSDAPDRIDRLIATVERVEVEVERTQKLINAARAENRRLFAALEAALEGIADA